MKTTITPFVHERSGNQRYLFMIRDCDDALAWLAWILLLASDDSPRSAEDMFDSTVCGDDQILSTIELDLPEMQLVARQFRASFANSPRRFAMITGGSIPGAIEQVIEQAIANVSAGTQNPASIEVTSDGLRAGRCEACGVAVDAAGRATGVIGGPCWDPSCHAVSCTTCRVVVCDGSC